MTIEELKKFIIDHPENYSIELKRNYPEIYDKINSCFNYNKFSQKLFHFINGNLVGNCEVCNSICEFESFSKGYRKTCSSKCKGVIRKRKCNEIRTCVVCNCQFEIRKKLKNVTCSPKCSKELSFSKEVNLKRSESLKKTLLEKYGVDHPSKIKEFVGKSKQTKIERYGIPNFVNVDKARATKKERYGDENYVNIEKVKSTKKELYGDENYNNREKFKKTLIDKYGTPYSPNVVSSIKKSISEGKLGFGSEVFKESMLNKYGTIHCNKNEEVISKSKITRYQNFLDDILLKRISNVAIPLFNIDEYKGTKNGGFGIPYKFKCKICNSEFEDIISNGKIPQCKICYPIIRSKSQCEIVKFISSILPESTEIITNTKSVITPLELDIYVPKYKIAIEFDGLFWHSEVGGGKGKEYHLNKTLECEKMGIRLIHIFEDEWWNKKDIVEHKLKHLFKINGGKENTLFARKCEVKLISSAKEKEMFLKQYHLQGNDTSGIWIGAYHENHLVSIMTFGNLRISLGNNTKNKDHYEMYRFCTDGRNIVGIASKLLNFFIKTFSPSKIVTYADRRWSNGNLYTKIGFGFINLTPPNYWYIKNNQRIHRYSYRKSELSKKLSFFDPELTEWENMKLNGFDRIWDCGNYKFSWERRE